MTNNNNTKRNTMTSDFEHGMTENGSREDEWNTNWQNVSEAVYQEGRHRMMQEIADNLDR